MLEYMNKTFPQDRKQARQEAIQVVMDTIKKNGGLIDSNSFDGVINHFKDLIFEGLFSQNNRYGSLDGFLSEFKAKLKREIYRTYPHLKDVVETNIDDLSQELVNNTKLFTKKNAKREKKLTKLFDRILDASVQSSSTKVRINKYAELLYKQMSNGGLREKKLDDILLVEASLEKLIQSLVKNHKIILSDSQYSEEERVKAIDELRFKFNQQIEKKKQNYYNRISLEEKKNEEKIASRQEKYEAKTIQFVEKFIDECKIQNIYNRNDIVKFTAKKLRARNFFTYKNLSVMAPMILSELKKQPTIFPDFKDTFIIDFLSEIRLHDKVIGIKSKEIFGQPKAELGILVRLGLIKKPALKTYENFNELKEALLARVENYEFNNKDMLNIYIPELINELIDNKVLKIPDFNSPKEREEYISKNKQAILKSMKDRLFNVRKEVVNSTINDLATKENFASIDSASQLKILVNQLKDNKLLQGRLHYEEVSEIIIERIWGMTPEIDPAKYKQIRNKYRQVLLNTYERTTNNLQFKLKLSNNIGLGFSVGSAAIGIYGFIALLVTSISLPIVAGIPIMAVCAIITSGSGLAMSKYASNFTKKKEISQDIIDKIIGEEIASSYTELFKNMPTVGELVMGLFNNNTLKAKGRSEHNLYFEFTEHIRNLDQTKIKAIINEMGAEDLDITNNEDKKKFFVELISRLTSAINTKIDYYESKTKSNAEWSLKASLGTFSLGSIITATSMITEAATGTPVQSTSALGQVLGGAGAAITATGGLSIANAYMLSHTKESFSAPLIRLRTNLNVLSNYIEEDQAHIHIPDNICKVYKIDPAVVNQVSRKDLPQQIASEAKISEIVEKPRKSYVEKLGLEKKMSKSFVEMVGVVANDDAAIEAHSNTQQR